MAVQESQAWHLIDNIAQAIKAYEFDHGVFPPGDGRGSSELVRGLSSPGPKRVPYYEFTPEMLGADGVVNPVWPGETAPRSVICYRNLGRKFDLWCEGGSGRTLRPPVEELSPLRRE